MENYQHKEITQDERLLAFVSQIIAPLVTSIIIYFLMKDSRFVRFYALQSIYFNCISLLLMGFMAGAAYICTLIESPGVVCLTSFLTIAVLIISFAPIIYGIIIGVNALRGQIKEYPIVGKWALDKIYPERNMMHSYTQYHTSSHKKSPKGMI